MTTGKQPRKLRLEKRNKEFTKKLKNDYCERKMSKKKDDWRKRTKKNFKKDEKNIVPKKKEIFVFSFF